MSLYSMCKSVMAEVGWPIPQAIATNPDATAQQIFSIANTELRAISELFNWPHLEVEFPVTIPANSNLVMWPSDFRVLAANSVFNKDQYYEIKGSTGMQFWQLLKYGKLGSLNRIRFRTLYVLGAPSIEIVPAPTSPLNIVAVYYSNQYALTSGGGGQSVFQNDDDVPKVPERYVELGIKWRFRRAKGLDFSAELAEYNNTISTQFAKYCDSGEVKVGGFRRLDYEYAGLTPGYVPYDGFGA